MLPAANSVLVPERFHWRDSYLFIAPSCPLKFAIPPRGYRDLELISHHVIVAGILEMRGDLGLILIKGIAAPLQFQKTHRPPRWKNWKSGKPLFSPIRFNRAPVIAVRCSPAGKCVQIHRAKSIA